MAQPGVFQLFAGITEVRVYQLGSDVLVATAISVVPFEDDDSLYLATFTNVPVGVYRINLYVGASQVAFLPRCTFYNDSWRPGGTDPSLILPPGPVLPGAGLELISAGAVLPSTVKKFVSPLTNAANACKLTGRYPGYVVSAAIKTGLLWSYAGMQMSTEAVPNDPDYDLTSVPDRYVMFNNPFCGESVHLGKLQIKNGQLAIFPPTEVLNNPGVYNMEVNWTQSNVTRTGTAIVSVEQSLMGRGLVSQTHGPLQFSRVQTRLRDNPESNDILGGYEFTAEEFITAMLECVEYYNEVLPYGATYTVDTFPYRQHWLDATISRLLMTTAMWQQRNFVEVTGEGITSSARAKYQQLMQQSQVLWDDYRKFVAATKHAQNARSAFRIM